MVCTVTLAEQDINAISAALDERQARLLGELAKLQKQPESSDRDFALECNREAIRDGVRVRLLIASALAPDYDEDVTWAM